MEDAILVESDESRYISLEGSKKSVNAGKRSKTNFQIPYFVIFWTCFVLVSFWAVADRFLWNLFPMTINSPPILQFLPSKFLVPVESIDGTIIFFDGFGRATGRWIVTVFAALFWTQVKTTENFVMEHCPSWIHLGDLRTVHNRIHYILGVFFMAIPLVVHCLLVFLPSMNGVPLRLVINPPQTKVTPFIFANVNAVPAAAEMFITHDNVYRAILVVLLFVFVLPFSMSNWARKRWFSTTQFLHLLAITVFSIDMIRKVGSFLRFVLFCFFT